jgi:phosphoglycolate phosphatase
MMKKGTVFFDYDGTLHNSMLTYGPAFREVYSDLVKRGYLTYQDLTDEEISRWLGWTVEDMWTTFAPELPRSVWVPASKEIGRIMEERLLAGQSGLFPGIKEALIELRELGYELVFLSNCGRDYRDKHLEAFGIKNLFSAAYTAEEFDFIPKWQIYQQVATRHSAPHVMVGDRFHDIEVATHAGICSIGCAWGFGDPTELESATLVIDSPDDIICAVKELIG